MVDVVTSSRCLLALYTKLQTGSCLSHVGREGVLVDLEAAFPGAFAALGADDEERLRGNVETLAARNTTRLICLASAKARG